MQPFVILASIINSIAAGPAQTKQPEPCPPPHSRYDCDLFNKDIDAYIMDAEFLYWTVDEGALDYAEKMTGPAWSSTDTSYAFGKVKTATFNFDPGFRVAVGYFNAVKYYEVYGQYTHLISRGKNSVEPPTGANEFLTGTFPQITTLPLSHAHSDIFFDYNTFNLIINRVFVTNPHLRLRLSGGGTCAWIHQDWKVQYYDGTNHNTTIRNRWNYIGGGLYVGVKSDWFWGSSIYLTGSASLSALIGSYRNRAKQTTTFQPTPGANTALPVRNSDYKDTRPALCTQFMIGPSWQKNLGCHRMEVFAGYELAVWLGLQEIRRSSGGTPSQAKETWLATSALALQGLTARVTFDY
jgi:hypothetical protein